MIQTTQKTMHNQTLQKWATLSNTVTRYSLSQTLMSNALQYKASKGFRYIYYICRWCWGGGGGFVIIFLGDLEGVQSKFAFVERGLLCNISPCEAHFPLPPPPPDNYCTVPNLGEQGWCCDESTCLPPMWPVLASQTRRHM